jgi:hypothetical protein
MVNLRITRPLQNITYRTSNLHSRDIFNLALLEPKSCTAFNTLQIHMMNFLLHPAVPYVVSVASGAVILGFGLSNILYPHDAYTKMQLPLVPSDAAGWAVVEHLMVLSGAKNLIVATLIFAAMLFGTDLTYGTIMLGYGAVAISDGWILRDVRANVWFLWVYGGFMVVVGVVDLRSAMGKRRARACEEGQAKELFA